jgi:hypothetical protein
MKTAIAFVFVPVPTVPEFFQKHARECLATPGPKSGLQLAKQAPEPFWTWFIPNPRLQNPAVRNSKS